MHFLSLKFRYCLLRAGHWNYMIQSLGFHLLLVGWSLLCEGPTHVGFKSKRQQPFLILLATIFFFFDRKRSKKKQAATQTERGREIELVWQIGFCFCIWELFLRTKIKNRLLLFIRKKSVWLSVFENSFWEQRIVLQAFGQLFSKQF
jgi:hypothetical protein